MSVKQSLTLRQVFAALCITLWAAAPAAAIVGPKNPPGPTADNPPPSGGNHPAVAGLFNGVDLTNLNCSGSLISPMHVLTAAHCLDLEGDGNIENANGRVKFQVFNTDTPDPNDTKLESHDYMRVRIQKDWDGFSTDDDNDIAIIKLKTKVTGITPLGLYMNNDEVGKANTLVGWGRTNDGTKGVKRHGNNEYDGTDVGGKELTGDFDGPVDMTDVGVAGGDSGGPGLINGQVAGVQSSISGNMTTSNRQQHGGSFFQTRVSVHKNDFILPALKDMVIGNFSGNWTLGQEDFIPSDSTDPKPHFGFDTINVTETATDLGPFDIEISLMDQSAFMDDGSGNRIAMLALDKKVTNNTGAKWTDFHLEIGTGIGANFVRSNESDIMFFKTDPAPIEELGAFKNPPMQDDPADPDALWWFEDPPAFPGVAPGGMAQFWTGIQVPDDIDGVVDGMAMFTIRQIATIPEPTTLSLLAMAGIMLACRRRR